jgi:hypothetical protein
MLTPSLATVPICLLFIFVAGSVSSIPTQSANLICSAGHFAEKNINPMAMTINTQNERTPMRNFLMITPLHPWVFNRTHLNPPQADEYPMVRQYLWRIAPLKREPRSF